MRPLLVNQKEAAEMLGVSVKTFCRLERVDQRLTPAVIPETGDLKRYLVEDLEKFARSLKYPELEQDDSAGVMWRDESAA